MSARASAKRATLRPLPPSSAPPTHSGNTCRPHWGSGRPAHPAHNWNSTSFGEWTQPTDGSTGAVAVNCRAFTQHKHWRDICRQCKRSKAEHPGFSPSFSFDHRTPATKRRDRSINSTNSSPQSPPESLNEFMYEDPAVYSPEKSPDSIGLKEGQSFWRSKKSLHKSREEFSDYASLIYGCPLEMDMDSRKITTSSPMSGTMSSNDGERNGPGNRTLSSMDGDQSGSGRGSACCLSPATRIRLAADSHRQSTSDDDSGCALEEYAWVPSGLRPDLVHQYFCSIPEDKVPYVNSMGEKWRVRQLLYQLPPHDTESRYCRHLEPKEQKELRQFAQARKREALGRGTAKVLPFAMDGAECRQCGESMVSGDLGIFAARAGESAVWHPGCFVCDTCEEILVDLIYFCKEGRVYCGRHHAELLKPRCAACDEIILAEECTEAEGSSWHMHHFACFECDEQLGGKRYVIRDERPYCVSCFQTTLADACVRCSQPITVDQAYVTHDSRHWHAAKDCFSCGNCGKTLLGQPFLPRNGDVYCGVDCCSGASMERPARQLPVKTTNAMTASMFVPPPPLHLNSDSESDNEEEDENIYETVPSFRNGFPPARPPPPRPKHKQRRRHRSLTDIDRATNSPARSVPPSPKLSGRSVKTSHNYGDGPCQSEYSQEGSVVRFCEGRRGSGSDKSYSKACANPICSLQVHTPKKILKETTFGVVSASPSTSSSGGRSAPQYASSTAVENGDKVNRSYRRSEHRDCHTCSSSSDSDSDSEDFWMKSEYLAAVTGAKNAGVNKDCQPAKLNRGGVRISYVSYDSSKSQPRPVKAYSDKRPVTKTNEKCIVS